MRLVRCRILLSVSLCLFAGALTVSCGSGGSSPDASNGQEPAEEAVARQTIGAMGGMVALPDGAAVHVPEGALNTDITLEVKRLSAAAGQARTRTLSGEIVSAVYSFTPHGTQFTQPVTIVLPVSGSSFDSLLVYRAEDGGSNFEWSAPSSVTDGMASFTTTEFSEYVLLESEDSDWDPDPYAPGTPSQGLEGEFVATVDDSRVRSSGTERLIFDGTKLYSTYERDGRLTISSVDLSGPLPATPKVLLDAPWAAASGWSHPPLIATSTHLVLPIIGVIDLGKGLVESHGWATLQKDGTNLKLDVFDNWWVVGRGANVIIETFYDGVFSLSPADGSTTPVPDFPRLHHGSQCVYDATADEVGCLNYGIVSYSFKTSTSKVISESLTIEPSQFGSKRIAFNSSHWFVPVNLPSGGGIGAFPRSGSGSPKYHEKVAALGATTVDDTYLYACLDGSLTRISLADDSRSLLSEDCGNAQGVSILGMDESFLYYVHSSKSDFHYPHVHGDTLKIQRVSKTPRK